MVEAQLMQVAEAAGGKCVELGKEELVLADRVGLHPVAAELGEKNFLSFLYGDGLRRPVFRRRLELFEFPFRARHHLLVHGLFHRLPVEDTPHPNRALARPAVAGEDAAVFLVTAVEFQPHAF